MKRGRFTLVSTVSGSMWTYPTDFPLLVRDFIER